MSERSQQAEGSAEQEALPCCSGNITANTIIVIARLLLMLIDVNHIAQTRSNIATHIIIIMASMLLTIITVIIHSFPISPIQA